MVGDEHHPSPPKLLDHAEAVIEHHREADDHGDPYDAAEHDLVDWVRKHRGVIVIGTIGLGNGAQYIFDSGDESVFVTNRAGDERDIRINERAVDPPGDR
jgi:hypothetical protein